MKFPKRIEEIVKNLQYSSDCVGRSTDTVIVFEDNYILKVSTDIARLKREKERTDWLDGKIIGAKSIDFIIEDSKAYYLRTIIKGESLLSKRILDNPKLLISILKEVKDVLRSLDDKNCPFPSLESKGNDFVHGDLCLPNIYVDENNHFSGFIDLENMGLGDSSYDYCWMLWSFEYNLGTKEYTNELLKELEISIDSEKYNKYVISNM